MITNTTTTTTTTTDQAADRGPFICQSQSMNIHMPEPSTSKLTSMHFYAWRKGLKTGMCMCVLCVYEYCYILYLLLLY